MAIYENYAFQYGREDCLAVSCTQSGEDKSMLESYKYHAGII